MKKNNSTPVDESFVQSLQRVLLGMPGHTYCKDLEGVYIACNDSQAKLLGFSSPDSIIGKTDFDLPWKRNAEHMQANDQYVISSGKTFRAEEIVTLPDGSKMIYLSHKVPYRDEAGNIIGVMGMSFDTSALLSHDMPGGREQYKDARVLLVEDNRIAQLTIMMTLRELGCYAVAVGRGGEAIEAFRHENFNLVYMDIGLPDLEGYDVVKAIREIEEDRDSKATIVVLTAHKGEETEKACIESGADGILSKPLSGLQSKQVIDRFVLDHHVEITGFRSKETLKASSENRTSILDAHHVTKTLGLSEELVGELLKTLISSIPDVLQKVKAAKVSSQFDVLQDEVHKFHGGLHYVGVPRLEKATNALERDLAEGSSQDIEVSYQKFLDEISVLLDVYKEL
jgi:CheY-like chemotaxis protein